MFPRGRSLLLAVSERPGRLPAMDGLRALAVSLVFAVHFSGGYVYEIQRRTNDHDSVASLGSVYDLTLLWLFRSHYGVFFFFVISGFLIGRIVLFSRRFNYFGFLRNRFLRIYPALALSLLIAAYCGGHVFHGTGFEWRLFLANLALLNGALPGRFYAYLFQTWSLWLEWVFYALFPVTFLYWKWGLSTHRALFCCAALALPGAVLIYYNVLFVLFFAGLAVAMCPDEWLRGAARRVPDALVAALYFAVTSAYYFDAFDGVTQVCLYAMASGVLLTKACFGSGWINRLFSLTPLRLLGTVSYSFFLLHVIIIQLSFRFVNVAGLVPRDAAHSVPFAIALAATTFVASLAAACILYIVAERPYFATSVHVAPAAT